MAETDIVSTPSFADPQHLSRREPARERRGRCPQGRSVDRAEGETWPARGDARERSIVFQAFELALRDLRGEGRDVATELLRSAREAWRRRSREISGTPEEIEERLARGRYLMRRFSRRYLRAGFARLAETCPDLLVRVRFGEYAFPFDDFKDPASPRLVRLEQWCREREGARGGACPAGSGSFDSRSDPDAAPKKIVRAINFPRSDPSLGEAESPEGGARCPPNLPARTEAARREIQQAGPAIQGQGGDRHTFMVCCIPDDYALPEDIAEELLERFRQSCVPPWTERDFQKKRASARRNRKRPVGYKVFGHAPAPDAPPRRLAAQDVSAVDLWDRALDLDTPEGASPVPWVLSRGLDPGKLARRDLARALPAAEQMPRWARFSGQTWAQGGMGLVVPVFDATGELAGVRARWTGEGEAPGPKEVAPCGQRSLGLVYANAAARAMLRGGGAPAEVVTIVEGAPDFLTLAMLTEDPVVGVFSGSWTAELAARIPDGARVLVATHADHAGEGYARQIFATLVGRCEVGRMRTPPGRDVNEAYRRGELGPPATTVEVMEPIDLRLVDPPMLREGLCEWDRRALTLIWRFGRGSRGPARELARTLLTVVGLAPEPTPVKALARALVRLAERRELPSGVEIRATPAELAELGEDVAVVPGIPGVQGEAADEAGPVVIGDGGGGLGVAAGAAAVGAEDEAGEVAVGSPEPRETDALHGRERARAVPTAERIATTAALLEQPEVFDLAERDLVTATSSPTTRGSSADRVTRAGGPASRGTPSDGPPCVELDQAAELVGVSTSSPTTRAAPEVHRDFKPDNAWAEPTARRDFKPENRLQSPPGACEGTRGGPATQGPTPRAELADLAARVDQDGQGPPAGACGDTREAAQQELMRTLARATAAVRARIAARRRDGPT